MRAARVDANQAQLVDLFRAHGCEWESTARMGRGFPDGIVGWRDKIALCEIKTPKGKLRPQQTAFHRRFPVWVVRNSEDVAAVVRHLKESH